jgi:hypothetical protein
VRRLALAAALATVAYGATARAQQAGTAATTEAAPPPATDAAAPGPADAPLPPKHRITYSNLTAIRLNPLGLENRTTVGIEERLWEDPGILTRDAYVGLKLAPILNPALVRLGAQIEVKPAAVLALRAGMFFKGWFGSFAQLDAFPTPTASHCDDCMKDHDEAGTTVGSTTGFESELGALAQVKLGPIAVRQDAAFFYADADTPGATVHYDSRLDMVVPDAGYSTTQDTDLLYVTDFGLAAGARFSAIHAFYRDDDYLAGESTENPNTPAMRLGPAVAYTFFEEPGATFDKPTLILLTQWWLEHRYRTGAADGSSQAFPFIALAFRFEGRLWGSQN